MAWITTWFPPALSGTDVLWLMLASLLTSALTAATGVGGGTALLAVMANILPVTVIIPVHGLVQLGSNAGRLLMLWRHVHWSLTGWFVLGCLLGSALGGQLVISLPQSVLQLMLGLFILLLCWLPLPLQGIGGRSGVWMGGVTAFVSMFIGATGPFVLALLKNVLLERHALVATMAALMSFQHLVKVGVFIALGVALHDWLGLILLMVMLGGCGTLLGSLVLQRLSNHRFALILKVMITLLALRLLYAGFNH